MKTSFDLIVLGQGPGGCVAALRAAHLGLKTAIVAKRQLEGVCPGGRCIPSKSMIHNASLLNCARQLAGIGIKVDASGFRYDAVFEQARKATATLSKCMNFLLEKNGVTIFHDTGTLVSPNEVLTSAGKLMAQNIIIAAGSRPRELPGLEFCEDVLSLDDFLMSDAMPKSVIIVGGGAVGCEFAYILNSFGVKVTLVEIAPRLLPFEDDEISKQLELSFKRKRIDLHLNTRARVRNESDEDECEDVDDVYECEDEDGNLDGNADENVDVNESESDGEDVEAGVTLVLEAPGGKVSYVTAEKALIVAGRIPNTEGLGIEELGITLKDGFIIVDERFCTSLPSVFAIGDVIHTPTPAHVASKEGELAVEYMAGNISKKAYKAPLELAPNCVYCEPQVAGFGMTQAQAKSADPHFYAFTFHFHGVSKAFATGKSEGMVKILASGDGKILGAHIIGPEATELIHELALAASDGVSVSQAAEILRANSELAGGMGEFAGLFEERAVHA